MEKKWFFKKKSLLQIVRSLKNLCTNCVFKKNFVTNCVFLKRSLFVCFYKNPLLQIVFFKRNPYM